MPSFHRYDSAPAPGSTGRFDFASDNTAGVCPEAWEALSKANAGYEPSYGNDRWTARAADLIRDLFETDCEIYFVFNGTAANSLSLASLCQSYHSVICHDIAHIERDECGAPEFFSNGTKLLTLQGAEGKLHAADVEAQAIARTDLHFPKPRVVSLTQSTEVGTVYSVSEIQAVCDVAKRRHLSVHMDGARFANAAVALRNREGASPADFTWKAGVDVLSLGGTKNGMNTSEAVVFFNKALSQDFEYRCKQAGQLASKMRFLSSQWVGVLESGAWFRHAAHANSQAAKLGAALAALPGCRLSRPPEANAVFFDIPTAAARKLDELGWHFYSFIGAGGYRLMCSWATSDETLRQFTADVAKVLSS